jgi:hypothetical protein
MTLTDYRPCSPSTRPSVGLLSPRAARHPSCRPARFPPGPGRHRQASFAVVELPKAVASRLSRDGRDGDVSRVLIWSAHEPDCPTASSLDVLILPSLSLAIPAAPPGARRHKGGSSEKICHDRRQNLRP